LCTTGEAFDTNMTNIDGIGGGNGVMSKNYGVTTGLLTLPVSK
jgi:hypothetical protein